MAELTEMQQKAFVTMQMGKNVFITGPGGVGKSHLVMSFANWAKTSSNLSIAVTSTTGVSALNINGSTLHSWSGIGYENNSVEILTQKIMRYKKLKDNWKNTDILVIDEISMLKPELFDKLDKIGQNIRQCAKPFGGMQLVLMGDFLQLKPVVKENPQYNNFCFEAESWNRCIDRTFHFTEIIRQPDLNFQELLNNVRMGNITKNVVSVLQSRLNQNVPVGPIRPTKLHSKKGFVNFINNNALKELKESGSPSKVFEAIVSIKNNTSWRINKDSMKYHVNKIQKMCQAVNRLELAIGSQVMLICNMNLSLGYANGSRGVVIKFEDNLPVVLFRNGKEEKILPWTWSDQSDKSIVVSKTQIPLALADAFTIHKAQGSTIDLLEVDLGPSIFACGQTYTALSRARNLNGLFITNINYTKIKANPKVLAFYKELKECT